MKLWIRSQDKENLIQPNYINIGGNKTDKYFIWGHNVLLGKYKSKKRALEVLDEIQSILNLKDIYKNDREIVLKSWENMDAEQVKTVREQMGVYEMPEE